MVAALRVAVVEDQDLYRQMLVGIVRAHPTTTLVASAGGASEARRTIVPAQVDVVVMDVELTDGNGLTLGLAMRRENPRLGVVLISSYDVMDLVLGLPDDVAGRWSYLSKMSSLSAQTLVRVLWGTARGDTILDPELVRRSKARRGSSLLGLTPRQFEVLQLISQGFSNRATAERLSLSVRSVEGHLKCIYDTLQISNDGEVSPRVSATIAFLRETSRTP